MDALETLVREALAEHAQYAPAPDRLVVPPRSAERGRRRWPYALLAAAAVVAVAVGVVIVRGGGSHSSPPAAPTFAPIPAGMNEVSYHGITIQVPNELPIGPAALCRIEGVHTADPGEPMPFCPLIPRPTHPVTDIELGPYHENESAESGSVEGEPYREVDLRGPGVTIYVAAPTRRKVRAILGSVRVTPVDRNGCAATGQPLRNVPAATMLPARPTAVSECVFAAEHAPDRTPFLVLSLRIDRGKLPGLVAAIQHLPTGRSGPPADYPGSTRYQFTYADGGSRTIDVTRGNGPTVTDGQHVAYDRDDTIAAATN